ncbi:MAG: hypothetical protein MZW92_31545 [Comamonadaceae bacterium]|nr:hypothetical protein [Comamonadaceae bacterium]
MLITIKKLNLSRRKYELSQQEVIGMIWEPSQNLSNKAIDLANSEAVVATPSWEPMVAQPIGDTMKSFAASLEMSAAYNVAVLRTIWLSCGLA